MPGYPGYEACSLGGGVRSARGLLGESTSDSGYRRVRPCVRGRRRNLYVHVAVLLAHRGRRPSPRHHAAHENGVKADCALGNLAWKTRRRNEADKRLHGTAPRTFTGRAHRGPAAEALRLVVLRMWGEGVSYQHIAAALLMHRHSVSRIVRGLRHARVASAA